MQLLPRSTAPAEQHAPPVAVSGEFIRERTPPAEWVEELRRISPRNEAHGWLELVWERGDEWMPGQRWVLYELVTPEWANPEVLKELLGPHPRSEGHICTSIPISSWVISPPADYLPCLCRHKTESWRGGPAAHITLTQWELFKRTGCVGRPFWVIQGEQGGHKCFYTKEEERILGDAGRPIEPPGVGELEYAPFDGRVIERIMRFNRLQQVAGDLRRYRKTMGAEYEKYKADLERDMRLEVLKLLDADFAPEEEAFRRAAADDEITDHIKRDDFDIERVEDEILAEYVEHGTVADPRTVYDLKHRS